MNDKSPASAASVNQTAPTPTLAETMDLLRRIYQSRRYHPGPVKEPTVDSGLLEKARRLLNL